MKNPKKMRNFNKIVKKFCINFRENLKNFMRLNFVDNFEKIFEITTEYLKIIEKILREILRSSWRNFLENLRNNLKNFMLILLILKILSESWYIVRKFLNEFHRKF